MTCRSVLGGLRELGAGQFLLHVVRREHVGIGEAHDFLGAGSDQRSDIGCGSRTRDASIRAPSRRRNCSVSASPSRVISPATCAVGEIQELAEVAGERLDRQLADRNLDVGLERGGDVAAPRLLRAGDALDRVDRVEQPLGHDGRRVAALGELARNLQRIEHDRVAAKLAPQRVDERTDEQAISATDNRIVNIAATFCASHGRNCRSAPSVPKPKSSGCSRDRTARRPIGSRAHG